MEFHLLLTLGRMEANIWTPKLGREDWQDGSLLRDNQCRFSFVIGFFQLQSLINRYISQQLYYLMSQPITGGLRALMFCRPLFSDVKFALSSRGVETNRWSFW